MKFPLFLYGIILQGNKVFYIYILLSLLLYPLQIQSQILQVSHWPPQWLLLYQHLYVVPVHLTWDVLCYSATFWRKIISKICSCGHQLEVKGVWLCCHLSVKQVKTDQSSPTNRAGNVFSVTLFSAQTHQQIQQTPKHTA